MRKQKKGEFYTGDNYFGRAVYSISQSKKNEHQKAFSASFSVSYNPAWANNE
jgi:hypothetical protein